jgi:hypothetical protein
MFPGRGFVPVTCLAPVSRSGNFIAKTPIQEAAGFHAHRLFSRARRTLPFACRREAPISPARQFAGHAFVSRRIRFERRQRMGVS